MINPIRLFGTFVIGVSSFAVAYGQPQVQFARDTCVKVKDGKAQEYAKYLQDVTVRLAKVRVDAGVIASYTIGQAVAPVGRAARCDYHIVALYDGFPPEAGRRRDGQRDRRDPTRTPSRP